MRRTTPQLMVDLTQPLRTGQPVYPGDPTVEIVQRVTHETAGHAVSEITMGSHDGTHMDAGYHFFPFGRKLDEYPASRFVGRAVVLDIRVAPDSAVPAEQLAAAIAGAGGLQPGDFALLWFGWDQHYGGELMWQNPYLSAAATGLLIEAGVTLVGVDTPNVDRSAVLETFPVHEMLLGNDVLIVENLCSLDLLGAGPCECALLPLPILGGDGGPVRAVAWKKWLEDAPGRGPDRGGPDT